MAADKVSISRIAKLHPKLRSEVADVLVECEKNGVSFRITSTLRTPEEQDALYATGRTKPGRIVTMAKAWQSFHQYGVALDICLLHKDGSVSWDLHEDLDKDGVADWNEVVKVFKSKGWEWAGEWKSFREAPHFQKTYGIDWKTLYEKKSKGQVDENGYVLI